MAAATTCCTSRGCETSAAEHPAALISAAVFSSSVAPREQMKTRTPSSISAFA